MPKPFAEQLPVEVIDAIMAEPDLRARAEKIVNQLFVEVEYSLNYGKEPSPLARLVMPAILRWMETREQADRDREAAEQFEALRFFVSQFRRQHEDDDD